MLVGSATYTSQVNDLTPLPRSQMKIDTSFCSAITAQRVRRRRMRSSIRIGSGTGLLPLPSKVGYNALQRPPISYYACVEAEQECQRPDEYHLIVRTPVITPDLWLKQVRAVISCILQYRQHYNQLSGICNPRH